MRIIFSLLVGVVLGYFLGIYVAARITFDLYREGKLDSWIAERIRNARKRGRRG